MRKISNLKVLVYGDFKSHNAGIGNDMRRVLENLDSLSIKYEFYGSKDKKSYRILSLIEVLVRGPRSSSNIDLVYAPHVLPKLLDVPHIVRVHDIFPLTNPKWFKLAPRVYFKLALWSQKRSFLLFDSQSSYLAFRDYFGEVHPKRYSIMYCEIRSFSDDGFCQNCDGCVAQESLNKSDFALSVGTIEPRKNYQHLLNLWKGFNEINESEIPLYIVGSKGWKSKKLLRKLKAAPNVIWLGRVCDSSLGFLYSRSKVFISASLAEGFNLPIKEALSFGTPAVISEIPVHLELYRDEAIFFQLDTQESFFEAVRDALNRSSPRPASEKVQIKNEQSNLLTLRDAIESTIES